MGNRPQRLIGKVEKEEEENTTSCIAESKFGSSVIFLFNDNNQ
jgi:hypothetical protein